MPDPITKWSELVQWCGTLEEVDLACRGESRVFPSTKPRLDRCVQFAELAKRLRVERALLQRFREHAPIYLSTVEQQYLQSQWLLLVVMQHYGGPTRLLDWTKSPWVAAYFAVASDFDTDGRILVFRRNRLEERLTDDHAAFRSRVVCGPHPKDMTFPDDDWDCAKLNDSLLIEEEAKTLPPVVATYYCRQAHFPRLVAQQGFFTFASQPNVDHWQFVKATLAEAEYWEMTIQASAKPHILRMLNNVGLNGATLFPGTDGIGKSLDGFARCWAMNPPPSQFAVAP